MAFDRLLVRLFAEGNPPWRLKGGYALELKLSVARTTRDLDLGLSSGMPPGEQLLESLQTAAARDAGDFFVYATRAWACRAGCGFGKWISRSLVAGMRLA